MRTSPSRIHSVLALVATAVFTISCSQNPAAPSSTASGAFASSGGGSTVAAVGDVTNNTATLGQIKICKAGNVSGTFTIAGAGGSVTTLPNPTIPAGQCVVVAQDSAPGGPGIPGSPLVNITITETSAGLQSIALSRNDAGVITVGTFVNGGTLFLNNYHGATLTFTNNVTPPAQLAVNKTPDGGVFQQGAQVSFTIVVSNPAAAGSATANNVTLTDALPGNGGLVWATATTSQGTCVSPIVANNLSCSLGNITPQGSVTVTVTSTATTPAAACTSQPNPAAIATSGAGALTAQNGGSLSCTPPPPVGLQGCTPGYWKNHQGSWQVYAPGASFNTTFGIGTNWFANSLTLAQAAALGGGQENALARHAVAALLGAASSGVDYPLTTAQVIQLVKDAYNGTKDVETVKNQLAANNELGCPLN